MASFDVPVIALLVEAAAAWSSFGEMAGIDDRFVALLVEAAAAAATEMAGFDGGIDALLVEAAAAWLDVSAFVVLVGAVDGVGAAALALAAVYWILLGG